MWKHRDTDEQKRLVKFTIAKTMRLTLEYPELAQEYFDSLCKVIPDNERITVSNYHHNLTSDAKGEEMLTVPRKRVMEIYNHCNGGGAQAIEDIFGKLTYDMNNDAIITPLDKFKGLPHLNEKQKVITDYEGYAPTLYPYEDKWFVSWISSEGDSILDFQAESPEKAIELAYNHLFGSKCLPDEKQEVTQFKFKVGDKVVYHPFKSNSFYNAEVLEIRDKEDKPYLLHLEDAENLWAYSIEVQSIVETYPDKEPKPAEPKLDRGQKCKIIGGNGTKGLIGQIVTLTSFVTEENAWAAMLPDMSFIYLTESDLEPYTDTEETEKGKEQ